MQLKKNMDVRAKEILTFFLVVAVEILSLAVGSRQSITLFFFAGKGEIVCFFFSPNHADILYAHLILK